MSVHPKLNARGWIVLVIAAIAIAGHGFVLFLVSSHIKLLSSVVIGGLAALVILKHIGIASPFAALIRRRFGR